MREIKKIVSCLICSSSSMEELWYLPKLPLTEKYGKYDAENNLFMDQLLLFCNNCGHVQLSNQISPHILYAPSEYSFRTTQSYSAQIGTQVFLNFFERIALNRKFTVFLDIGGNDLYLANIIKQKISDCYVIDPICKENDGIKIDGINVIGKFIEEADLFMNPDLIFCRHVLEHLSQPREILQKLFSKSQEKALFIFEVPCLENLIISNRWDAIFHQHYHYFDADSFKNLIIESGGEYLTHSYNHHGPCGGSLMIAFKKAIKSPKKTALKISHKLSNYRTSIREYTLFMELLANKLQQLDKNIYGYGASLMLATFAYHLKTDLRELICILDDDKGKSGYGYQNLPVEICHPEDKKLLRDANFIITSLENCRSIYQKLLQYQPKRILMPYIS